MEEKARHGISILLSCIVSFFAVSVIYLVITEKPIAAYFDPSKFFGSWTFFLLCILAVAIVFASLAILAARTWPLANMSVRSERLFIIGIMVWTFALRSAWVLAVNVLPKSDFNLYHTLAIALSNGKVLYQDYIALFPHIIGYPIILSLWYRIFGSQVLIAQLLNAALGYGIALLLYLIGKKISQPWAGILAALLWSLWPSQIFYVSLVSTEEVFAFAMLACVWLALTILGKPQTKWMSALLFACLGASIALTNAIRPFGMLFLLAVLIYYVVFVEEFPHFRKALYTKIIYSATLALSFWLMSSILLLGVSKIIGKPASRSPLGFNILVGSNMGSDGKWNAEDANYLGSLFDNPAYSPQQMQDAFLAKAIARVQSQGAGNLTLLKNKFTGMWVTDNDPLWSVREGQDPKAPSHLDVEQNFRFLDLASNFYFYMVMLLVALCGVCMLWSRKRTTIQIIFLLLLGIVGVHLIVEQSLRYHYPAIALFALMAGCGLMEIVRLIPRRKPIAASQV